MSVLQPFTLIFSLALFAQTILADSPPVFVPPNFTTADVNRDEQVDRDEQGRIIIDRFDARDLNADGQLTRDEMPAELFSSADNNKDEVVSKPEFLRFRFGVFQRFDENDNEVLDREEYRRWLDTQ